MFCYILLVLYTSSAFANLVSNVRVIDHANYTINVITQTVRGVEAREWCNLKVPDVFLNVDELVLGWHPIGTLQYKNGFVSSIQAVDIQQNTVQSTVALNSNQLAQASLRGTLRMHNVAMGYDVEAHLQDGFHKYTSIFVYPIITFAFTVIKVIDTDDISVAVVGAVASNLNIPTFMPADQATDVFTTLYNRTMSNSGIYAWGPEVFEPIATEVVKTRLEFPYICYHCS